jgi:hypothetical protein
MTDSTVARQVTKSPKLAPNPLQLAAGEPAPLGATVVAGG